MLNAKQVKEAVSGQIIKGNKEGSFSGICIDSRKIKKGDLFIALKGERFDGHDFVLSAIEEGAKGAIIEERHGKRILDGLKNKDATVISVNDTLRALGDLALRWRKMHPDIKVIAVTGSSGKTTTKEMIHCILSQRYNVFKNLGNYNNLIGLPISLLRLNSKYSIAVFEMGMNAFKEIERLTQIADPEIGIITNIGNVHLEGVGDIRGVAKAKAELAKEISDRGILFVNGDNRILLEEVMRFGKKVITFGIGEENEIELKDVSINPDLTTSFSLIWGKRRIRLKTNLLGIHNAMNALISASVALYLGMKEDEIRAGLLKYSGMKGRFQIIRLKNRNILIDDTYNSNPLSLKMAIQTLKEIRGNKRLIIGLGDMLELGRYSADAHREAGKIVSDLKPDLFIAIGKFSDEMINSAKREGMKKENLSIASDLKDMSFQIEDKIKDMEDTILFLKGSRRMELDKVSEYISERFGIKEENAI